MGGSWFKVGPIFGVLYRGDGVFDAPLFSLGLTFLLAGGIGVIAEYLKRSEIMKVNFNSHCCSFSYSLKHAREDVVYPFS